VIPRPHPGVMVASGLVDLKAPANAVVVCTPPARHGADTQTALTRLRAHVLCEKPAVLDPDDGCRLASIAADSGLLVQPVHNYLQSPAINELRAVATRVLTHVSHIVIDIVRTGPAQGHHAWRPQWRTEPRNGGGILYDHGPHACYLACHLTGQRATAVSCSMTSGTHGADHTTQLRLRFANGATAAIMLSWHGTTRIHSYELRDAHHTVRMRNGRLDLTTRTGGRSWATEDHARGGHAHTAWTKAVHHEFLDQITNSGHTYDTWDMAIHVAQILHAAHLSASTDQRPTPIGSGDVPGIASSPSGTKTCPS